MTPARATFYSAVYAVLTRGDRVLLMRRAGSGFHDDELGLPAGHLDGGESAVAGLLRELREEVMVEADPAACTLATVLHRAPEFAGDTEYVDFVFTVDSWRGEPAIGEPDKCTGLVWAHRGDLPADVIPYIRTALEAVWAHEPLVLIGWT
jgi:8-oxo-dGTP diphosphatase